MKKKLLVIGVSGLTGYKIAKLAGSRFEVFGTYNTRKTPAYGCETFPLDITNTESVAKLFGQIRPDYVINTAALHNVDYCEGHPGEAFGVNRTAVETVRNSCDKLGSKMVHLSTDYVFDGVLARPYSELDEPNPLGVYGKSKLGGEQVLRGTRHCVIRPSVVYGWTPLELSGKASSSGKPMNFAIWLLQKLGRNEAVKIVTDQFASATLADSLADSAIRVAASDKSGLYHVSGLTCESRYDFSVKLAKEFGYGEDLVRPADSSQLGQRARRPSYSCLDCKKAVSDFDLDLYTTDSAVKLVKSQVEKDAPQLLR